jgi:hypothetical protein
MLPVRSDADLLDGYLKRLWLSFMNFNDNSHLTRFLFNNYMFVIKKHRQ